MFLRNEDEGKISESFTNNVEEVLTWSRDKSSNKKRKGLDLQLTLIMALQMRKFNIISWKPRSSKLTYVDLFNISVY